MKERLYNELAKYYDLFNFSDYKKQSDFIDRVISNNFNKNNKIKMLDLACGTGEHIKLLKNKYQIEGADINPGILKVARNKNPENIFYKADLNRLKFKENNYDVIYCLSSSIQYILSPKDMLNALKQIYFSLKKKGIFIFDLGYCKEKWIEGYVGIRTIVNDDFQAAEIFKSRSKNNISYYNPIYLVNKKGHFKFYIDDHKIYLYSIKEIKQCVGKIFKSVKIIGDYGNNKYTYSRNKIPVFVCKK